MKYYLWTGMNATYLAFKNNGSFYQKQNEEECALYTAICLILNLFLWIQKEDFQINASYHKDKHRHKHDMLQLVLFFRDIHKEKSFRGKCI